MTEIKLKEQNQITSGLTKASMKIRLLTHVDSAGDRLSTGSTIVALERGGLNPDMALDGLAHGKGLRILEGRRDNWLPERDPSQPVSVLEQHGSTLVHTRELLSDTQGEKGIRKFIINVVTAGDAASVGLGDLSKEGPASQSSPSLPNDQELKPAA